MGAGYFVQMKPFDEEERKDEKKVKELQEGSLYPVSYTHLYNEKRIFWRI